MLFVTMVVVHQPWMHETLHGVLDNAHRHRRQKDGEGCAINVSI